MNSIKYLSLISFSNLHISPDSCNDQFRALSKTIFNTHLVSNLNINKCLTQKKRLKMCDVYFTIFKIRKYVKYYLRLPCEQ